jgi:cyclopropane fatty-acyl-phospholipid synthase-like methyltransferase
MRIRYIGPHIDGVDVLIPTDVEYTPESVDEASAAGMLAHVAHKGIADFPRALAERLLEQASNWEQVKPHKSAKPAAKKREGDE